MGEGCQRVRGTQTRQWIVGMVMVEGKGGWVVDVVLLGECVLGRVVGV